MIGSIDGKLFGTIKNWLLTNLRFLDFELLIFQPKKDFWKLFSLLFILRFGHKTKSKWNYQWSRPIKQNMLNNIGFKCITYDRALCYVQKCTYRALQQSLKNVKQSLWIQAAKVYRLHQILFSNQYWF